MTPQSGTGKVVSKSGKVVAKGKIVTGIDLEGAASDAVLQTALEAMRHLRTGDVIAAEGVEAGEIITGLRYLNPQAPDRESFVAELEVLRQELAELAAGSDVPPAAGDALESVDEALAEVQKEKPLTRRLINRLGEAVEFIGNAGKALDAAHKAGPLILKAVGTATVLYQTAQVLF